MYNSKCLDECEFKCINTNRLKASYMRRGHSRNFTVSSFVNMIKC